MRLRRLIFITASSFSILFSSFFAMSAIAGAQTSTSTVLQVIPACLQSGCVTTLTATVTAGGAPVYPGLVVFCDKGPTDCQNEAPIGHAQLTSNGTAIIRLGLAAGPHTLRAIFHGTKTYASSASSVNNLTDTATAADIPTAINAPSPNQVNEGFTFTSYLNAFGPIAPTGTVSLVDTSRDSATIASGPVAAGTSSITYTLAPSGFSQIPTSVVTAGVAFATGDFNNDGFQDIAELASNTNLIVFLGDGAGNFKQGPVYSSHTGAQGNLLVGDFNSDGKLDVAICDSATSKVYVSLGNGNGTFTAATPSTVANPSQYLYAGDFNGDGIPDLFSVSSRTSTGSTAQVLLGVGDGTFTAQTPLTFPGETFAGGAVGDFDGDGIQDVAVSHYVIPAGESTVANQTSIFRGNGDGTFVASPAAAFTADTGSLVAGDFDGDGITDLLTFGGGAILYYGHGNFTFTAKSGGAPGVLAGSGDFTNSGNLQVAFVGTSTLIYDGKAGNGLATVGGGGPYNNNYFSGGYPADFNGDGLPDFFFANNYPTPTVEDDLLTWQPTSLSSEAALDSGVHNIIATYSGDASHNSSSSVLTPILSSGVEYTTGFAGETGLTLTGSAALHGNTIQLTDGGQQEAGAFFSKQRIDVSGIFVTDFDFQLTNATGDGFAFVLQSNGPNAIGSAGGGLGYGNPPGGSGPSITNSLAVAFDLHNNQGEGSNSIRLERDGVTSADGAVDLTPKGLDLHSGHPFHVQIQGGSGGAVQVILTDLQTNIVFPILFGSFGTASVNNELLHGSMAYAGFTGSTGSSTAIQVISNWTIGPDNLSEPPLGPPYPKPTYPSGFLGSTGLFFNGVAAVSGSALQLTNGTQFQATSVFAIAKVLPQGFFTTDFDFQIANGVGDGFAFVLQNDRLASLGTQGGGLGYGPDKPGASEPSIPDSLAIKFDIHDNAGESPNSTGLYLNGASPTTPSIDLFPTGINLQSGHTFHARIESNGTQLTLSITDLDQYANFTTVLASGSAVESIIPQFAFAGFTAGTGTTASSIKILNWTWAID